MSLLKRSVILFTALLLFFGSGGWVLTNHLCRDVVSKCESSATQSTDCCSENETASCHETLPEVMVGETVSCCFDQSIYFTMPVYRVDAGTSEIQTLTAIELALPEFLLLSIEDGIQFTTLLKPPLIESGGITYLLETGLLRI